MNPRERARRLRRLGVRGTIAAFVVAWALVFGQLALGHDPALGGAKKAQTQTKTKTKTDTESQTDTQSQSSTDDSSSSVQSPAPVTTAQS
jgi:hypothetical protein